MKKRLCLLALCLAALLGLSLFFVACDDEPAPGPTPTPVEHTHSYTSVTIAMADYMGKEGANAGKFIKDVAVPCSGEDCDSTLTLTKDELNAVFAAIMEDEDAAGYTAKVEGGNNITSFKVTKGEYTVTVNLTQPHTHTFNAVTISFDEYIDMANETWKKPLEVPCFYSPRGCTGKLTFTVGELNAQMEQEPKPVDETTVKLTLTKDGHAVTVTVTGFPTSEGPGSDEPYPPVESPFSIAVKIGQEGLVDDATYTYCVGTTVAYTVTVTDTSTGEPVTGDALQYLSATYQIDGGDAVGFTQQAANFTFATVGTYTIVVTYNNDVDEPATFTCTAEVSEHEGTYHAAKHATCTEDGTVAYLYCEDCRKYFKVTGTADDYVLGNEFDYNNGEGIINQEDPAKGHSYTSVTIAMADYIGTADETRDQFIKDVSVPCDRDDCNSTLTLTKDELNAQIEQEPVQVDETTVQFTLTKDGHEVTVTVTGVSMPTPQAQYTVGLNIGEDPVTSGGSSTICVGSSVAYAVTMTKDGSPVADVAAEAAAARLSAFYTIGDGNSTPLINVSGNFTFEQTGTYVFTISVTGSTFTYTVEVQEHTWAYTASNGAGHYRACSVCGHEDEQLYNHEGAYAYDAEKDAVVFTCSVCNGTVDCEITGLTLTGDNVTVDGNDVSGVTVTAAYDAVTGVTATAVDVTEYVAFTVSIKAGDTGCEYTIQAQIDGVEAAIGTMTFTKDHQYDAVALNEQTAAVEQTCSVCDKVNTIATLTDLSVDWAEAAVGSYTVGATIQPADFEVSYTYSADVTAYAETIEAAITDNIGTLSTATAGIVTVEFQLGDKTASIEVRVYDTAIDAGSVTAAAYLDRAVSVGDFVGEFTLSYSISDLTVGAKPYNSWVITFAANNGAIAVLRPDDYILNGWRVQDCNAFTNDWFKKTEGANGTYIHNGNFIIERMFVTDHYEIVVTIADGTSTVAYKLVEPTTNGVTMSVFFGGDGLGGTGSYNYSDVLYCPENVPAVSSISATATTAVTGTSVTNALQGSSVTVNYEGISLTDVIPASACTVEDEGNYDAMVAATYSVTISYGGKQTTVSITLEEPAYSLLTKYAVDGESFTNGTAAVGNGENGTFANSGFKANAIDTVMADNPYVGQSVAQGVTIHLEVYANTISEIETPIISIENTENNAFLTITQNNGTIWVRYNDMVPNYIDGSVAGATIVEGQTTEIVVEISIAGNVTVFVNGEAKEFTIATSGGTLATGCIASITNADFDKVVFFGGATYWPNLFDGYIQSCSFYNGLVPAEEISAL